VRGKAFCPEIIIRGGLKKMRTMRNEEIDALLENISWATGCIDLVKHRS